jgi:hypothetical protein
MSGNFYNNASLLSIELDTGYNLVGATNTKILFQRPDMTKGDWPATIMGTVLKHDFNDGDLNMPGVWSMQSYFEVGGKKAIGNKVTFIFKQSNL